MKGFSVLEIIISLAVAGVLLAIITNSFQVAQIKKSQQGITESIVSYLEEQKTNTQTGKDGKNYGIKFNAADFILFTGTTYSESSFVNKVVAIDPQFQIDETILNNENAIYFSKINGEVSENATITISHITNRVSPKKIIIEKSGSISVVE